MLPVDKVGRPIYPSVFRRLKVIGQQLHELGFKESKRKSNLFFKVITEGCVFADMRGTDMVPIWEDPIPLVYYNWRGMSRREKDWKVEGLTNDEMRRKEICFELLLKVAGVPFRVSGSLERPEGGFCEGCGEEYGTICERDQFVIYPYGQDDPSVAFYSLCDICWKSMRGGGNSAITYHPAPAWDDTDPQMKLRPAYGRGWTRNRKQALERDEERCVHCGATEELCVHHINKNPSDQRLDNLLTLCTSCHKEEHRGSQRINQDSMVEPA